MSVNEKNSLSSKASLETLPSGRGKEIYLNSLKQRSDKIYQRVFIPYNKMLEHIMNSSENTDVLKRVDTISSDDYESLCFYFAFSTPNNLDFKPPSLPDISMFESPAIYPSFEPPFLFPSNITKKNKIRPKTTSFVFVFIFLFFFLFILWNLIRIVSKIPKEKNVDFLPIQQKKYIRNTSSSSSNYSSNKFNKSISSIRPYSAFNSNNIKKSPNIRRSFDNSTVSQHSKSVAISPSSIYFLSSLTPKPKFKTPPLISSSISSTPSSSVSFPLKRFLRPSSSSSYASHIHPFSNPPTCNVFFFHFFY
jgi:hypothetical protein